MIAGLSQRLSFITDLSIAAILLLVTRWKQTKPYCGTSASHTPEGISPLWLGCDVTRIAPIDATLVSWLKRMHFLFRSGCLYMQFGYDRREHKRWIYERGGFYFGFSRSDKPFVSILKVFECDSRSSGAKNALVVNIAIFSALKVPKSSFSFSVNALYEIQNSWKIRKFCFTGNFTISFSEL